MEITIKGSPKEIIAFVLELQKRQTEEDYDETQKDGLHCLAQHFVIFYEQSSEIKEEYFAEACIRCRFVASCKHDWLEKIDPYLRQTGLRINLARQEILRTPGTYHTDPV